MIPSFPERLRTWFLSLALLLPFAHATGAPPEPLPVEVFRKLQDGEKQTVVVYGTSLTRGGGWAKALAEYFDKEYPGQVVFANSAQGGMHSRWGVANLEKRVLDHRPDLVFIEFSANDAATKHRISREASEANLDRMVKDLRQRNPKVDIVIQTMNPAWDSPETEKNYGSDRPELESYYEVYRSYAGANRLPLADHHLNWAKLLRENPRKFRKAVPDGIHPHGDASRSVTWSALRDLLEKARAAARTAPASPAGAGA